LRGTQSNLIQSSITKVVGDFFFSLIQNSYICTLKNKKILKKYFIILLSSIILLPAFGNLVVYVSFKINQDEISKTICVQRKVANNTCNGRCELRKSLKKFEDNEKKMDNNLKEKLDLVYIPNHIETTISTLKNIGNRLSIFSSFTKKPISVSTTTFRPPLV
jgi:hypothetical protein